ncbi:MAG: heme exporter protein CcmD [Gammaproteobacteria bacterium]|nr:heme exporter protein CcmD [Gammaproteobacteria bacterium]
MSLSEFLHMGGYAPYVWGSYGIWLVVMVLNVVFPLIRLRETRARLARMLRRQREES